MNVLAKIHQDYPLYLDDEMVKGLETWEDWVTTYLQLTEASNSFSWLKADMLSKLYDKFGGDSLDKFATDVGEPRSTVTNYVRVARAFPPETRIGHLSFSHHYQASFADSYDETTQQFVTDKRFEIIENAADRKISTRQLKDEVAEIKEKEKTTKVTEICDFCKKEADNYQKYVFFSPGTGLPAVKLKMHPKCYQEVLDYIETHV